jgi:hypothetical protein
MRDRLGISPADPKSACKKMPFSFGFNVQADEPSSLHGAGVPGLGVSNGTGAELESGPDRLPDHSQSSSVRKKARKHADSRHAPSTADGASHHASSRGSSGGEAALAGDIVDGHEASQHRSPSSKDVLEDVNAVTRQGGGDNRANAQELSVSSARQDRNTKRKEEHRMKRLQQHKATRDARPQGAHNPFCALSPQDS